MVQRLLVDDWNFNLSTSGAKPVFKNIVSVTGNVAIGKSAKFFNVLELPEQSEVPQKFVSFPCRRTRISEIYEQLSGYFQPPQASSLQASRHCVSDWELALEQPPATHRHYTRNFKSPESFFQAFITLALRSEKVAVLCGFVYLLSAVSSLSIFPNARSMEEVN